MKATGKLVKRTVNAHKPTQADRLLWCSALQGFGIRYNSDATRTAVIQYRNRYGQSRRYSIGKLSDAMTLDEARSQATGLLREISRGADPAGEKRDRRAAPTLGDLFDAYLESAAHAAKADSTRSQETIRITRHLRPLLGWIKVEKFTPDRVRRTYNAIKRGDTALIEKTAKPRGKARVSGGETSAKDSIKTLSAVLNWEIRENLVSENPCKHVKLPGYKSRDVILETVEEYGILFAALDKLRDEDKIPDAAVDAIKVLAYTGARRDEIAAARWQWVDLKGGSITLPADSHKSGHRSGAARVIHLGSAGLEIVKTRAASKSSEYVFPGRTNGSHVQLTSKLWEKIRTEAKLRDGVTNHSLRHSLGTLMAAQGAQAAQIQAALGHSQLSTTQKYLHLAQDMKAQILEDHTASIRRATRAKDETGEELTNDA